MAKSLAGTGAKYKRVRGRIKDGHLHVQGRPENPGGNRSYGVAVDIDVPLAFKHWLNGQAHTKKSLADSEQKYVPMQVRLYTDDTIHFQVAGTEGNRGYGWAFTAEDNELAAWLRAIDA